MHQGPAGIDVEMVGRLIEQQDMRLVRRHQGEQQARLFATGQIFRRRVGLTLGKPEAAQLGAHHRRCGVGQTLGHMVERRLVGDQFFRLMLGEIADTQLLRRRDAPRQWFQTPGQQAHEGRFAVAVGADQGDAVVHVDAQVEPG